MAVERWTGNACEILEIDPQTLVEMAAEDEPLLKAPRVPISGLNIAAAFPSEEMAKSLRQAMADSDVSRSLAGIQSMHCADAMISPELRLTMDELLKGCLSSTLKDKVGTLVSPQIEAVHKQQNDIARVVESPVISTGRGRRPR